MGPQSLTEGLREAPMWAQQANTVLIEGGRSSAAALGGLSGAFTAGVLGGAKAGTLGAMVGAAGGGVLGAALGYKFGEEEEGAMRAWVMDFLPWSSLQPQSKSPEAEPHGLRGMMDISPMEPFGILMPLMNVFMGDAGYGQDIPVTGSTDAMSKALLGFAGFLAPPMMQRYGMRVGGADTGFFNLGDAGGRLGGAVTGGLAGLAAGGPGGGVIGAGAGALAGMNTSRFEEEIGMRPKTTTGEPGNIMYDFLFNQWTGMKTWKATPEQRLFNEKLRENRFSEIRNVHQKNMDAAIMNGDENLYNHSLGEIERSFTSQYVDPMIAQQKFGEYLERRVDKLGAHPQLKGYSQEELQMKLREAIEFATKHRTEAARRRVEAIRKALLFYEINRESKGLNIGGYDYDIDLATGLRLEANKYLPAKKTRKRKKGGIQLSTIGSGGIGGGGIKSKGIF
jgi:hypothetical protein